MPSTRRQNGKARRTREISLLYVLENMDKKLGDGKSNPIEKDLPNTNKVSVSHNDTEAVSNDKKNRRKTTRFGTLMSKTKFLDMID